MSFEFNGKNFQERNHMALLRNLRNIATYCDEEHIDKALAALKAGVLKGKQFPFRYWNAYNMIQESNVNHKGKILDALEECMDIAIDNMPKLKGKTYILSDNSGSAWGGFTSEFGRTNVATIDNLSSVILGKCSEEATVGKFGDKLIEFPVKKRDGVLSQFEKVSKNGSGDVGGGTESGVWKFFDRAIKNKEFYDRIVIYSDMQCGTGGLYGTSEDTYAYTKAGFNTRGNYINVYKLILEYQKKVNPKCNFYCCQTAGYNNVLIPQMSHRCAMLTGWNGNQADFIERYENIWDNVENN